MNPFQVAQQTANNMSRSYNKVQDQNTIESILSQAAQSQDPKQVQSMIGQILSQVSPERQGDAIKYLQNTYQQMQQRQQQSQTEKAYENAGMGGMQYLHPSLQTQLAKNQIQNPAQLKADTEKLKEEEVRKTGQNAFNGLVNLLKKNNVGRGSNLISKLPFASETQKDIGEFSALTGGLEAMLVDMVSRGTLSNTRFKYITETLLPKPDDPQETIKGKLTGLAEILQLDTSILNGKSKKKKPMSESNQEKRSLDLFFS